MSAMDALSNLGSFIQGFQGLSLMSDGGDMAMAGAEYNASLFRMAATSSVAMAEYNVGLSNMNYMRQRDAMATKLNEVRSTNKAAWSASGFGFGSGSYMATQNKVMTNYEKTLIQNMNNQKISDANTRYEGEAAAVNYRNQAKAAEYQGQLAQYQADSQQAQGMASLFSKGFSLFMS